MGVGRRMKKQGPPEPLSDAQFAKLKRKAGLPVDEPSAGSHENKKRRTNKSQPAKGKASTAAVSEKQTGKPAKANGVKAAPAPAVGKKGSKGKPSKVQEATSSDDEDDFDLEDVDGSEPDLDDDEFSNLDSEGENGELLGDDFLGSDDSVLDSDQEDGRSQKQTQHMWSEDEDDSDGEEALTAANVEGLSRKLEREAAEEAAEAQAELEEMGGLQTNIDGDKPHVLGQDEDDEMSGIPKAAMVAPDLAMLRQRITDNIRVLEDFSKLAEEGRSRVDYTTQLVKDIAGYYSYSEYLAEKLLNLFPVREALAFFDANESARPVVLRTNTLKTSRRELASSLINRGVTLEPVGKWSKVGLQVFESSVPLGATPEYLAGHYILMAASSFLPVMALEPQEGERVLDMASAPGGKATFMSAMMRNKGLIIANDPNKARAKGLIGNIHRLGCRNVIVSNYDAREFPKPMGGFDRVLLDAPCSGTGVIAKDPSVKTNKTEMDFIQLPHLQKQLLLAAIDSVNHNGKNGGFICYSTCSVTIEENEQVVAYALSRRPNVKLVDTGLPFGKEGFTSFMGKKFDPSLKLTRRYYPHTYNVDGFFVAKFQKTGPTPPRATPGPAESNGGSAKSKSNKAKAQNDKDADVDGQDDIVDKTPISAEEETGAANGGTKGDTFGGFDEEEDESYMEKAKRNAMRRRGLDPHALEREKLKGKAKKQEKEEQKEQEDKGQEKQEVAKAKGKDATKARKAKKGKAASK